MFSLSVNLINPSGLDYSPSDIPDCHKNSFRFTFYLFSRKKTFDRHVEGEKCTKNQEVHKSSR